MTIQHLYPTTRPSLDLNFAQTKRLDPRVTFTRGSTATYVGSDGLIKTAASNEARFDHDPATGESLGLLIEESRTNLVQYSEDFSQASQWSNANSTLTAASSITAPDGSTNTYKLVEDSSAGAHYVRCSPSNQCAAGTTYVYSMFVKAAERTQIMLHFDAEVGSNVYFDLSSGEIVSGTIGTIKAAGNGWYHCSITLQPASNTEPKFYTAVNGSVSTTGDGVSGVYIWGAQLEAGSFPTSYIPTSGSTATRSADVASMTGTNFSSWYNQNEGTVFVETEKPTLTNTVAVSISDGTNQNSIELRSSGSTADTVRFNIYVSALQYNDEFTVDTAYKRLIFAYAENNSHAVANGILRTTDTSVPIPTVDNLYFGNNLFLQTQRPGHIKRFTYYDRRLTDAQLQALTL